MRTLPGESTCRHPHGSKVSSLCAWCVARPREKSCRTRETGWVWGSSRPDAYPVGHSDPHRRRGRYPPCDTKLPTLPCGMGEQPHAVNAARRQHMAHSTQPSRPSCDRRSMPGSALRRPTFQPSSRNSTPHDGRWGSLFIRSPPNGQTRAHREDRDKCGPDAQDRVRSGACQVRVQCVGLRCEVVRATFAEGFQVAQLPAQSR